MINTPKIHLDHRFEVTPLTGGGFKVLNRAPTANENSALGKPLCATIWANTPNGTARQLEELLNETLTAGHAQGVASIRRALGIEL